ncbi:EAL domain-containing protein [Acinetobacter cumulans]|jgi:diguanylate cyclase (GGDEF)-like protein/PAS domain S-box-containing protein|uniref:EAL domain-containing protein n=1 Tax=Acinetobacter cumulans TaxID=2136182 RepID=A0A498D4V6_9GAMM|nr:MULTISPECIES: GGDEF domain-containing phosphodiesterase [Acinetobacter]NWK74552.1 EAL domain-containing protein [Acinetobacter sp. SwsAc6]RKG48537.1 phosphodiesterase [Acinetobacter cumulans]RLL35808.1 EAL domain-containing protein [Acinetobacter cumulans]RLL47475.1 EAL domain-containing protein [Acinetobacter cumulans]
MDSQFQYSKIVNELENYQVAIDAHSIVAITDTQGVITHVNQKFCDISKYSREELLGSTHKIINSGCHPRSFFKQMWGTIAQGKIWNGEICNRNKQGELYWVDTTIVPFKDRHGMLQQYIAIRTDITQLKQSEDHARYMALHDELTSLPNRRYMQDYMKQVIASNRSNGMYSAMIMLDLDNFKNINDTLGHSVGDSLLKMVATRLLLNTPQPNSIIRLGGDEFLVIVSNLSMQYEEAHDAVLQVANKLKTELNKPYFLNEQSVHTTSSSGVFIFKDFNLSENAFLKYADMALYHAKGNGKNCIAVFDPLIEESIVLKAKLINDLSRALQHDEFELYYQRIVNDSQQIIGYEALIRWQHPEKGLVLPGHFMAEIEKSSMIHEVGQKVLNMACQQLQAWRDIPECAHWTISVNISVGQFRAINFDQEVIQLVHAYGICPSRLRLELTESMFYTDMDSSIAKMHRLIEAGFNFSMDDFGTGYSSLNYLRMLPLRQLKIDRAFVEHISENPRDLAIVKTIIALAAALELNVVAEGVETLEQFQLLKDNGCTAFQGYYFGRPEAL